MTYTTAFEHTGLEVKEIEFAAFDGSAQGWEITNSKGHKFHVKTANWGQFTVDSEEKRLCTHCLFRTAVKLIKSN